MQYALRMMQQRGMSLPQEIALPPSTRALAVATPLAPAPPPEIYENARQSHIQWHMGGTKAYCSRLFGLFLLNSLTPTFAATLHSRIDQKYSSDGPLLLVTMCNHVHRNHLAFVESVKHKLRTTNLQDHNNDVPKYLQFLQDNTHLQVTKTQHITTFFRICSCSLDPPPIHYFSKQF